MIHHPKIIQQQQRRHDDIGLHGALENVEDCPCRMRGRNYTVSCRLWNFSHVFDWWRRSLALCARCLGINLPHPILLHPNGPTGDILDVATQTNTAQQGSSTVERKKSSTAATSMASSTSSLMSLMDATSAIKRSAKKALKRATGQQALQNAAHTAIPPSMEPSLVSLRLRHATAAVIAEDHHSSSSKYELSHSQMNDENFAIGLQLLQNDAVALCIRAGVPVANLWPAQAILLNLHALDNYCHEQVDDAIM